MNFWVIIERFLALYGLCELARRWGKEVFRATYAPYLYRRFGIKPPASFLISESFINVAVDELGHATAKVVSENIFIKSPHKWELVDVFYDSKEISRDANTLGYMSSDSEERTRRWKGKKELAIFWRPKHTIIPLTRYCHEFSWVPSSKLNDPINYWEIYPIAKTGRELLTVTTHLPVEKVICFRKPWWLTREMDIYRYALRVKETHCQPPKLPEPNKITWELTEIKAGKTYTCVFFHEGWQQYISK
jgi:hypothetical protein